MDIGFNLEEYLEKRKMEENLGLDFSSSGTFMESLIGASAGARELRQNGDRLEDMKPYDNDLDSVIRDGRVTDESAAAVSRDAGITDTADTRGAFSGDFDVDSVGNIKLSPPMSPLARNASGVSYSFGEDADDLRMPYEGFLITDKNLDEENKPRVASGSIAPQARRAWNAQHSPTREEINLLIKLHAVPSREIQDKDFGD